MTSERVNPTSSCDPVTTVSGPLFNSIASFFKPAVRKGLIALVDQSIVSATNFITGVIIGRTLSKEQFGLYMLGFTIVFFIITLQSSLILRPYIVFSPRLTGSKHIQYTGSTLIHQLTLSGLAILFLVATKTLFSNGFGPAGLVPIIGALLNVITFILLREYIRQLNFARLNVVIVLLVDLCVAILQIVGILVIFKVGLLSSSGAYFIIGGACALPSIWYLWRARRDFILSCSQAISDFKSTWIFAKWILASDVVAKFSWDLYPWLLVFFQDTSICGIFFACSVVSFLTAPFTSTLTNLLGPMMAHIFTRDGFKKLSQVVTQYTLILLVPFILIVIAVFFFGGRLVEFIYGSQYSGYGHIVAILALNPLITALVLPSDCGLWAIERSKPFFKSNVARSVVSILIGTPLVWAYGLSGIAVGTVLTVFVGSGYRFISFRLAIRQMSR